MLVIKTVPRLFLLIGQWYLTGVLAWTLWAPAKVVLVYWKLGQPLCQSCHQLLEFLLASFLFGLATWLLGKPKTRWLQLKWSVWLVAVILVALFLPSWLRAARPWQMLALSLVITFNLSLIVDRWPKIQPGWKTKLGLALGITGLYGLLTWSQWQSWRYPARDVAVFNQAIWHLARLEIPASSIKGLTNLWSDHFHPVLILFVPFYWLLGFPGVLLAQSALIGIGVVGTIATVERLTGNAWLGIVFGLSYGLFFGFQEALAFGFYPEVVIPVALIFAIYGLILKRFRLYWLALLFALLAKENVGIYLVFIGLMVMLIKRRFNVALRTMFLGIAWFGLSVGWLIPKLGSGEYYYASNLNWKDLINPIFLFRGLTFPPIKIETVSLTLTAFGFLPLFSLVWLIPVLPMIGERFIPEVLNRWTTNFHYSLPLVAFLVVAAAHGSLVLAEKHQKKTDLNLKVYLPLLVLVSTLVITVLDHRPLVTLKEYQRLSWKTTAFRTFLRKLPKDASLSATDALVPHLANRPEIYALPTLVSTDYVAIDRSLSTWPLNPSSLTRLKDDFGRRGYVSVFRTKQSEVFALGGLLGQSG